jgi:ribokinase
MTNEKFDDSLDLITVGCAGTFDHILTMRELPQTEYPLIKNNSVPKDIHRLYFGGCSFNIAVTGQSLGLRTGVINPVGRDFISKGYWDYLQNLKVSTEGLIVRDDTLSGHCYIWQDQSGATYMVSFGLPELLDTINPNQCLPYLEQASNLIIGPHLTSFSIALAKRAKESGIKVFLSSPFSNTPNTQEAITLISCAKVGFFNELEANMLIKTLGVESREELLALGFENLIITHGNRGSTLITSEGDYSIPIVKADVVVDPTGAGDAMAGATTTALIKGYSPKEAVQIGAVVSSFVVESLGCQTNLPDWETMLNRYRVHFGEL